MSDSQLGYQLWCEMCAAVDGDAIASWEADGLAAVRAGRLKVAAECCSCERPLSVGESARVVTFFWGRRELYEPWEHRYLEPDDGASETC